MLHTELVEVQEQLLHIAEALEVHKHIEVQALEVAPTEVGLHLLAEVIVALVLHLKALVADLLAPLVIADLGAAVVDHRIGVLEVLLEAIEAQEVHHPEVIEALVVHHLVVVTEVQEVALEVDVNKISLIKFLRK